MSWVVRTVKGKRFYSQPSRSLLESAIDSGVIFEHSCKNGQCGTCKVTLLEGGVKELVPQRSLSQKERGDGRILSCCCAPISDILIDAEDISALNGIEVKTLPAKISNIERKSSDIIEVVLRLPPTARFQFLPGQYIEVSGPNGVSRSYSIASSPSENRIKLLIKKVEGGVLSQYWFESAKENDLVRIEGPKGTFFIRDASVPLVFLATGTGIAPVVSMLQTLDEDDNFEQKAPIYLFWGNRGIEDFIGLPEFKKLVVSYYPVISSDDKSWNGKKGYIQNIALDMICDIKDFQVYACGSNKMIQCARSLFVSSGLPESKFYSDAFIPSA